MTEDKSRRPSEVRARVLAEHERLRALYDDIEALVARVKAGETAVEPALRERCRGLYQTLLRHISAEDAVLAPALRDTDGFGPARANELLEEHARQRRLLRYALGSLDERSAAAALLQTVPSLIASLRADMAHEERDLLDPDLFADDAICSDTNTG